MTFCLIDQGQRPLLCVLFGEGDVAAVRCSPRRTPGFAVEHESEQSPNLRLVFHELQQDACQPDRFLGQTAAALVYACHVIPAQPERGINRFQDGVEPLWQFMFVGNGKANAGIADLRLGAHQALPHGRG